MQFLELGFAQEVRATNVTLYQQSSNSPGTLVKMIGKSADGVATVLWQGTGKINAEWGTYSPPLLVKDARVKSIRLEFDNKAGYNGEWDATICAVSLTG